MANFSYLSHLECSRCARTHEAGVPTTTCECGGPLLARYDLQHLGSHLRPSEIANRHANLWRYHELLPVMDGRFVTSLSEGMTPLLPIGKVGAILGLEQLLLKDEGQNPTQTFKARGASVGISRAKELGVQRVVMPTAGNAGGAWSAYGARAGLDVLLFIPVSGPALPLVEASVFGASTKVFEGRVNEAAPLVNEAIRNDGYFDATTLKEPYRIEGKKTMGYEIAEQLNWRLPDVIVYPTGGGVGIIGIYKALLEMTELGWIQPPYPRLVAAQSSGCAPIVKAFEDGAKESTEWVTPDTFAAGMRVPKALAG